MPINTSQHRAKNILVVGGAGYIGSHMVFTLLQSGYYPIVLDNLSKGHRKALLNVDFVLGDMADSALLAHLFKHYPIDAIMHFASFIEVAESLQFPEKYYQNNVGATLVLLEAMRKNKIKNFIFSSSAAVYGEPQYTPIDEAHPIQPINPYGRSKWMVEEIIKDYARCGNLNYAILRYFNASGADAKNGLCERHEPESHLIPLVLQVAENKKPHITIYGDDYATTDGTCVRDYIHVKDICRAHLLALEKLLGGDKALICNLGTGIGYSVKQVLNVAREITHHTIPEWLASRREGDPAVLIADASFAASALNWKPLHSNLHEIVRDAWSG